MYLIYNMWLETQIFQDFLRSKKMGKKLLCLIMALCCVLGLVACGETTITEDKAGTDSTLHGGFVAETKDYVYFINGVESYSTDYTTGNVTKGALLRVKKADFANRNSADKYATAYETVVSKLLVSGDTDAGFYIYGDYVYYAVPSLEKDKTGTTKKDQLNFFRTKLDGSSTSKKIADVDFASSTTFRYIKSGDNVYLVVYSTDLYVYDAVNGGEVYTTKAKEDDKKVDKVDVSEVLFSENSVYFTSNPVNQFLSNEDNIQKDAFHVVYKVDFANKDAVKVIDGAGKKQANGETNENGCDILGVTIDLLRVEGGNLYFSYKNLNTVSSSTAVYVKVAESKLVSNYATKWYKEDLANITLTVTNKNTASIFTDSAIYYGGVIYYVDSTYGLCKYDPAKATDSATDLGVSIVYHSEVIKTATLDFIHKEGSADVLYFHDSSNNYYRLVLDGSSEEFRLNRHAINSSWYTPEVVMVDNKYYFVASYSDAKYKSYLYVIDMADVKTKYDAWDADTSEDKAEDFYAVEEEEDEDDITFDELAKENGLLGKISEADLKVEEESASESK